MIYVRALRKRLRPSLFWGLCVSGGLLISGLVSSFVVIIVYAPAYGLHFDRDAWSEVIEGLSIALGIYFGWFVATVIVVELYSFLPPRMAVPTLIMNRLFNIPPETTSDRLCPNCRLQIDADQAYCTNCGTASPKSNQ